MSVQQRLNHSCIIESLEVRSLLSVAPIELPGSINDLSSIVQAGDFYYYGRSALYRTDGTPEGTVLLRDFGQGGISHQTVVNDAVYFAANGGRELWRSDGTIDGTELIREIAPQHSDDFIAAMLAYGGNLYFKTDNQLWISDGSEAGTQAFMDGFVVNLAVANDLLFFARLSGGFEAWRSDGTQDGTIRIASNLGPLPPASFSGAGDATYFIVGQSSLWKTDGTAEGTSVVRQIAPRFDGAMVSAWDLTAYRDGLFFIGHDIQATGNTSSLWFSDGTADGTARYFAPAEAYHAAGPAVMGDALYFHAWDATGSALWKTDGTEAGTTPVKDLPTSLYKSAVVDGLLYLFLNWSIPTMSDPLRLELWQSDGTPEGTYPAGQEITAGAAGGAVLSADYFAADGAGAISFATTAEPIVHIIGRKAFVQVTDAAGAPRLYVMELRPAAPPPADPPPVDPPPADPQTPLQPLVITGTRSADKLSVARKGNWLHYTLNGQTTRIPASTFSTIQIRTGPGNDRIILGPGVTGVTVDAGPGNDIIIGSAGGNMLNGGAGNDLIIARQGGNTLLGAGGNDVLVSAGKDQRNAGAGVNRLYAGRLPDFPALVRPAAFFKLSPNASPAALFQSFESLLKRT